MTNGAQTLLVLVGSCSALGILPADHRVISSSDLVGVWQASPIMASGWNDAYLFYDDGTFVYQHNQMLCDNRDLASYGTWSILPEDGDTLKVLISRKQKLVGGFKVKSDGSCATNYMIEGGDLVMDTLARPEGMLMKLRNPKFDDAFEKPSLWIGGRQFWKFSDEPDDYYR